MANMHPTVDLALALMKWRRIEDIFTNDELFEWTEEIYNSLSKDVKHKVDLFWEKYKIPEIKSKSCYQFIKQLNTGGASVQFERVYGERFVIAGAHIRGAHLIMTWESYHLTYLPEKALNVQIKTQSKLSLRGFVTPEIEIAGNKVMAAMSEYSSVCSVEHQRIVEEKLAKKH